MPFKIVKTIEMRKFKYTIVPNHWEKDFVLRWPKRRPFKLNKKENSRPESNWKTLNCIVKRCHIATFRDAEKELIKMCSISETNTDSDDGDPLSSDSETSDVRPIKTEIEDIPSQESREIISQNNLASIEPNNIQATNTMMSKLNSIDQNAKESFKIQQDNQNFLTEFKQNILTKLSNINNQLSQITHCPETSTIVPRTNFKVISSLEELQNLDKSLELPLIQTEMIKKFIIIFGKGKGTGVNNAYVLIDAMFDRKFLNQCSWGGGSRSAQEKICFRSYKNVINLFFQIINESDNNFTLLDCHKFLMNILRNSRQRSESLQTRISTTKHRRKLPKILSKDESKEQKHNFVDVDIMSSEDYSKQDMNTIESDTEFSIADE